MKTFLVDTKATPTAAFPGMPQSRPKGKKGQQRPTLFLGGFKFYRILLLQDQAQTP